MNVTSGGINQIAKDALLDHALNLKDLGHVAKILCHHVSQAGAFNGGDQVPSFFNGVGGGDFTQHMLAGIERGHRLRGVQRNRSGHTDRIHIGIVQNLIVVCVKPEGGIVRPRLKRLGILIAYGNEFDVFGDTGRVDKGFTATGTDDGKANRFFGCFHLVA